MEKVLPESVPTRHLSGPLSPYELQQLFAQAPFGIGVFDHEFRCRDVNGRFAELTGLARTRARRCSTLSLPRLPSCSRCFNNCDKGPPDAHLRWRQSVSPARPPPHAGK